MVLISWQDWTDNPQQSGEKTNLRATVCYALDTGLVKTKTVNGIGEVLVNDKGIGIQVQEMPGIDFCPMMGPDDPLITRLPRGTFQLAKTGELIALQS